MIFFFEIFYLLHAAIKQRDVATVEAFTAAGAVTNIKNSEGKTSLDLAIEECNADCVAILNQAG